SLPDGGPKDRGRERPFGEIWRNSEELSALRTIAMTELPMCRCCALAALCTRCPGLAFMEGDIRGPSRLDGEKVLVRTGTRPPCLGG
ncbi:MAG: hypothetical protein RMI94_15425, partial [Bryobacterales bacterium]|nr:hypothetical protein [Bryobacterales bacterium]